MKIRRYLGSNTQEALLKLKMDLGNEAVILNTRKVRKKGLVGLFAKPMFEVLAAVDEEYAGKNEKAPSRLSENSKIVPGPRQEENFFDKKEEKISLLENRINNIEVLLQNVYSHIKTEPSKLNKDRGRTADTANKARTGEIDTLKHFLEHMLKQEVDTQIAERIIAIARERMGENAPISDQAAVLYNVMAGMLGQPLSITVRSDKKPVVAIFIGPTGVGKTTTLAKIAANLSLNHGYSVGMITADTYRIAAVEQLKTYAAILSIPISVIYTPAEIQEAISAFSDKDIVLIDTAGRSHTNETQFEELKMLVEATQADEIFLVLSAATSMSSCKEILKNYSFLKNYKFIFTKLDETSALGIILNARMMAGKPLSYVTMGQSVPDDIEVANIGKIAKTLLGSINK